MKKVVNNISKIKKNKRFAIKKKSAINFENDILEKFNHLLDIEALSRKI